MDTEVLKMVIDAVSDIGELGVWGLVAYLVTTVLLALLKYGTLLLIVYWIVRGVTRTVSRFSGLFTDTYMMQVRDHYDLGSPGPLIDSEEDRVRAKIKDIVQADMDRGK